MEHKRLEEGGPDDPPSSSERGHQTKINRSFDYDSELVEHYYNPDDSRDLRGRSGRGRNLNVSNDSPPLDTRLATDLELDSAANRVHGDDVPGSNKYPQSGGDIRKADFVTVDMDNTRELANDFVDDTLDSVVLEDRRWGSGADPYTQGELSAMENEAYSYDGDAETDLSYYGQPIANANVDPGMEPPVLRQPNPFPVLDRPLSGRYQKNPNMERQKTPVAPGPYDPNIGVFLAPPLAATKPDAPPSPRKRLPRPPSRLKMRCALFWSCAACLIGSFLCAIPALRYYVTANESRKIGDYNSAHSFLRKSALLAVVALALGVGAWVIVILHLLDSL